MTLDLVRPLSRRRVLVVTEAALLLAGAIMLWRDVGPRSAPGLIVLGAALAVHFLLTVAVRDVADGKDADLDDVLIAIRDDNYRVSWNVLGRVVPVVLVGAFLAHLWVPTDPFTAFYGLLVGQMMLLAVVPTATLAWRLRRV